VPLFDDYIFFETDQHPEVTAFLEINSLAWVMIRLTWVFCGLKTTCPKLCYCTYIYDVSTPTMAHVTTVHKIILEKKGTQE
jgi:hypothetical protein